MLNVGAKRKNSLLVGILSSVPVAFSTRFSTELLKNLCAFERQKLAHDYFRRERDFPSGVVILLAKSDCHSVVHYGL